MININQESSFNSSNPTIIDTQATYTYEQAARVSVRRVYGEMTLGLVVTALVAFLTESSNALYRFYALTGRFGFVALAIIQIALAVVLGVRIMKMSTAMARGIFYAYSALTGFTLSAIFGVFTSASIAVVFALTAGFFLCLTMLALTTKLNLLKAGPILMVALIVLIISQIVISFFNVGNGTLQLIAAIGLLIFAGFTAYDAQKTRALIEETSGNPEMMKRISILCALMLYLDFINMFVYLLQLIGERNE